MTNGHFTNSDDFPSTSLSESPTASETNTDNELSDSASDHQEPGSLLVPQAEIINMRNIKNTSKNSRTKEPDYIIQPTEIKKEIIPHCFECMEAQPSCMKEHFQEQDRPLHDNIKCKICFLILPTKCSLKAHSRIHTKTEPYVCPECGKDFDEWSNLYTHMEDVCFHLAKNVRYKCPARKCGKIFAQSITFSSHFPNQHLTRKVVCDICGLTLATDLEFNIHNHIHNNRAIPIPNLECFICLETVEKPEEHAKLHCFNPDNRIYVYTCKYCKSYYRSKQTYAMHLLRCTKLLLNNQVKREAANEKTEVQCKVLRYCKTCDCKIQFHCQYKDVKTVGKNCPQCGTVFGTSPEEIRTLSFVSSPKTKSIKRDECNKCVLCRRELKRNSAHHCRYAHPIVLLKRFKKNSDGQYVFSTENRNDQIELYKKKSVEQVESTSPVIEDNKKKRKRTSSPVKSKKQCAEEIEPIKPMVFNGEYICNICDFTSKERSVFHDHIQKHRDISTVFQCMECGECFVVKPSLIKHLQVFHLIENVDRYFSDNECFDKEAVRELQESMRMIPGESKEPVEENQCKVCREKFSNELELSKHFRVHGMAFLMKKMVPKNESEK